VIQKVASIIMKEENESQEEIMKNFKNFRSRLGNKLKNSYSKNMNDQITVPRRKEQKGILRH
jgi:hypothetical protein